MDKLSKSEYIVGDSIEADYMGNISLCDRGIRFLNIEFDTQIVLNLNSFICSTEIRRFIARNDDDTTYSHKVEEIKIFEFSSCKFSGDVYFNLSDNCILRINDCDFEENFNINKHPHPQQMTNTVIEINQLDIENCIFKKNFLLEDCIIHSYRIKDIKFEEDTKLFQIIFIKMFKNVETEEVAQFTNSIFNKSAIFEKVIFKEFIQFKYTSFKGYTLFRDVVFKKGLDLDYVNIENGINFSNIQELDKEKSKKETSQETYRIIKYNLENIGNKIESNKYHALELDKYRDKLETEQPRQWREYIVFKIHSLSSEHSTNWVYPLLYMILISLLSILFLHWDLAIKVFYQPNLFKLEYIQKIINDFPKYIYILYKEDDLLKAPWVVVFNKFSLGYLYYQFLLSVRKDTRK